RPSCPVVARDILRTCFAITLAALAWLVTPTAECGHEQASTFHRGRRLRSGAPAGRWQCPDRRRRSGFHAAGTRGNLFPGISSRRFRYLRAVDEQLHGEISKQRLPICRRAGVSVALVPA